MNRIPRKWLICIGLFMCLFVEATNGFSERSVRLYGNVIGFLLLFAVLQSSIAKSGWRGTAVVLSWVLYALVAPSYYLASAEPYKALLYALIAVGLGFEFRREDYSGAIERMFFLYVIVVLPAFFLGVGVDADLPWGRLQGLLSEPSALGLILPFLFWRFVKKKQYSRLLLVTAAAVLTFSLIVYSLIGINLLVRMLLGARARSRVALVLLGICGIFGVRYLAFGEFENPVLSKASSAALHAVTFGEQGRNTRAIETESFFTAQRQSDLSPWIGNGPFSAVYYYKSRETLAVVKNMPTTVYFDFGLFGLVVFVTVVACVALQSRASPYKGLFISALSYCVVNGASGIVNDIYLFALMFALFPLVTFSLPARDGALVAAAR